MLRTAMTLREAVEQGSTARAHIVQFFDTLESLAQTVADFVAEGVLADDVVLVVARADAWTSIADRLVRHSIDVDRAKGRERLVVLDAAALLSKCIRRGWPDRGQFDTVIGGLVRELAGRGRLRVYGEMVDVLAEDAQFRAAIALEELWNELAETVPFSLLCGYSAVHFGPERNGESLKAICRCHSATRVGDDDDLARWLLNGRTAAT